MMTGKPIRVALLGPLEVRDLSGGLVELSGARLRALVVRLALSPRRNVGRETLIDDLWGAELPSNPLNAVQALVSRVRRAAPDLPVLSGPAGYQLAVERDDIDLWCFEALVRRGRAELEDRPERAAVTLREALALWRGDELADAAGASFARAAAARARALHDTALADRIDADLATARGAAAIAELEQLIAADPVQERWHTRLVRALHQAGREAEALLAYERARRTLADELGADPSPELTAAHLAVLRREAVPTAPRCATVGRAASGTGLPVPLTGFHGRDGDVEQVAGALEQARLVTLLGPGGVGKTRLALEAARALGDRFPDGVRMVELAALDAPGQLADAVLAAVDTAGPVVLGASPAPHRSPHDRLADAVGARSLLIVLDNCEHVVAEAATLVEELLAACPACRVLATSREPLAIAAEQALPLAPLATPAEDATLEEICGSPAVRLLVERAVAVRPSFVVDAGNASDVARVCRLADGLPLALELAAARLRALSAAQLAERLSDRFHLLTSDRRNRPARHQTLHAVVSWSWDLLTGPERTLARRLAVFSGGATLEAVERICAADAGADPPPEDIVDLVTALVDKSLLVADLRPSDVRYRMLGSVREFLAGRLADSGEEDALRCRHAEHFLALAETAEERLLGAEQVLWLARLTAEHDNLHAALRWSVEAGRGDVAVRLVAALSWYWFLRGQQLAATEWARRALAVPGDPPADARALVAVVSGLTRGAASDGVPRAAAGIREWLELTEADARDGSPERPELAAFRAMLNMLTHDVDGALDAMRRLTSHPNAWARACGHLNCGHIHAGRAEPEQAARHYRAALREARTAGERWGQIQALSALAELARGGGESGDTVGLLEEARRLAVELGAIEDQVTLAERLSGELARRGDLAAARAELESGLRLAQRAGATRCLPQVRRRFADVVRRQGDVHLAAVTLDGVLAQLRADPQPDIGELALTLCARGHLDVVTGWSGHARDRHAEALDHALVLGDPTVAARTARLAADIVQSAGDGELGMRFLGTADALAGAPGGADPDVERIRGRCEALTGEATAALAYQEGLAAARKAALGDLARVLGPVRDEP